MQLQFTFFTLLLSFTALNTKAQNTFPANGFVGIGTTSPQQRLHVEGTSNQAIFVSTTAPGSSSGSGMIGSIKVLPTGAGNRLGYFLVGSRGGAESGLNVAGMVGYAGAAWTSTSRPAYLSFETTAPGSTSRVERMRISPEGRVSIGTSNSSLARFTVLGGVGNTTSIFGADNTGVSLQYSYPGISFNSYYNAGFKALAAGYGGNFTLDPTNGKLHYRALSNGAGAGSAQTFTTPFVITNGGTVGINNSSPDVTVDLHVGTTTGARLRIGDQTELKDGGNMILEVSSTFRPTADNAYRLGGSTWRWIDVWAVDGTINTSDQRDKTNIRDLSYGLRDIMKLHPVVFNWKDAPERGDKLGLIAQELQTVIKEAVVSKTFTTDEDGKKLATENERLGVYYSDLTPVLIKAIQEQQQHIESQQQQIEHHQQQNDELRTRIEKLEALLKASHNTSLSISSGYLEQNAPNPVRSTTTIRYGIPDGAISARLTLTNSKGQLIKTVNLDGRGLGQVNLDTSSLPAGVYNYSLWIAGREVDTKQLVITR